MTNVERKETEFLTCRHCQNYAPMLVVAHFYEQTNLPDEDDPYYYPDPYEILFEAGYNYELLKCRSCNKITLQSFFAADPLEDWESYKTLYPLLENQNFPGVPLTISRAYSLALKVKSVDINSYGSLLSKVVERICKDQDAQGNSLWAELNDLIEKRKLSESIGELAHQIRKIRNFSAHYSERDFTEEEIDLLKSLCDTLLQSLYTAPYLIRQSQKIIDAFQSSE